MREFTPHRPERKRTPRRRTDPPGPASVVDFGMSPTARLAGVSLDTSDPAGLAEFYRQMLGLDTYLETGDFVALKGAGILVTTQRVEGHVPADWPTGPVPKQIHLELAVDDLDGAEMAALALGATRAVEQPAPDRWRVLIDPAGHPFCITTLIPDDLGPIPRRDATTA
jgi:Glyoxalase-like domain